MRVTVKLYSILRDYLPEGASGNALELELGPQATVADLLATLAIPPDQDAIVLLNSVHAPPDQTLGPGDVVAIFPPIVGG